MTKWQTLAESFKPSFFGLVISCPISISFVGKTNVELYELNLKICDGDRSAKTHLKIKLCSIISLSRLFHHGHVIHSQCIPEMSLYDRFQGENRECKILTCMLMLSPNPQIFWFCDVALKRTSKIFAKISAARAARLFMIFNQWYHCFVVVLLPSPCFGSLSMSKFKHVKIPTLCPTPPMPDPPSSVLTVIGA